MMKQMSGVIKRILGALLLISTLLSLFSCNEERVRCSYAELAIDLPKSFQPYEQEGIFDAAFYDGETMVGIVRISFVAGYDNGIPDTLSPEKFAQYYMSSIGRTGSVDKRGDVPYFIYYNTDSSTTYFYLATFYRTLYAYFAVTYITEAKNEYKNTEKYLEYATSAYMLDAKPKGE